MDLNSFACPDVSFSKWVCLFDENLLSGADSGDLLDLDSSCEIAGAFPEVLTEGDIPLGALLFKSHWQTFLSSNSWMRGGRNEQLEDFF